MKKKIFAISMAFLMLIGTNVYASDAKNPTVKILVNNVWDDIDIFSSGMARVSNGKKYGYINDEGKTVINPEFKTAYAFHEDIAVVGTSGEEWDDNHAWYKTIDKEGNTLKYMDFTDTAGLSEGYSNSLSLEGGGAYEKFSLVDKNRNTENYIDRYYASLGDAYGYSKYIHEGLMWVYYAEEPDDTDGTTIYFNNNADEAFRLAKISAGGTFNDGLAPILKDGKYGFINKSGDFVIKAKFDDVRVSDLNYSSQIFSEGLAVVKQDDNWGAIDKDGNVVIKFQWDNMMCVKNSLIPVEKNGLWGYIDLNGKTVISPQYERVNYFNKAGYSIVMENGEYFIINKSGEVLESSTELDFEGITSVKTDDFFYTLKNGKTGIIVVE